MPVHGGDKKPNDSQTAEERSGLGGRDQGDEQPHRQHQAGGQQAGHNAGAEARGGSSLLNINSKLRRQLPRSTAGESVSRFASGFKEILDTELGKDNNPFRVLTLDNTQHMTALSAILVTLGIEHQGQKLVAVHAFIVEDSGGRLTHLQYTIGQERVEIPAVPGDTADTFFWDKVNEVVKSSYTGDYGIVNAGVNTLPKELEPTDKTRLHNALFNACTAVQTTMDNALGGLEDPFSISWIDARDLLTSRVDYAPVQVESSTGLPIRSDVTITLDVARPNQGGTQIHNSAMTLTRVDGYIDLVYAPPEQPMGMMPNAMYGQNQQPQRFFPRFVMTNVEPLVNAPTMELQLFGLVTATLLNRNMSWAGVFRPRAGQQGVNLRNIGAIGLEMPELTGSEKGQMIDTQASAFTNEDLLRLIHTAIHPELVYTIHVEETGDMSWIHLAFLAAADGDMEANEMIMEAANNLTNGRFSHHFRGGGIVHNEQVRVPLGYYIGTNGEMRDIRDIDYLALLNWVGEKDMGVVMDWCNAFDQPDVPIEIRLERIIRILQNVIGESSVRITGYARPVTFTPAFIDALTLSATEAGLQIRPDRFNLEFEQSRQRGNPSVGQFAVSPQQQGPFTFAQSGYGNRQAAPQPWGRWGH